MEKKKLMYLGGSHADIPMIQKAVSMGFQVITVGKNSEGIGHRYGHIYICEDFSDKEKILRLAKEYKIDFISPSCSDFSVATAAYVSGSLGLPGHDSEKTAEIIHKKDLFRQFCSLNNIRIPKFYNFSNLSEIKNLENDFSFPLIIKPVDSDSGKGITKVNNFDELIGAVEIAFNQSRSKRIVIEEFIEGTRHAASLIVFNKSIEFIFVDDEQYYLNPYMVAAASSPSVSYNLVIDLLKKEINKIIKNLDLGDGLLHVQFIVKDCLVYIIEACRRPPGEFYVQLVEYVSEVPYVENIIRGYIGKVCKIDNKYLNSNNFFIRQCIMADRNGTVNKIEFSEYLNSRIVEKFFWNNVGSDISNFLNEKVGVIFLKFNTMEEMQECISNMSEHIYVQMD